MTGSSASLQQQLPRPSLGNSHLSPQQENDLQEHQQKKAKMTKLSVFLVLNVPTHVTLK